MGREDAQNSQKEWRQAGQESALNGCMVELEMLGGPNDEWKYA